MRAESRLPKQNSGCGLLEVVQSVRFVVEKARVYCCERATRALVLLDTSGGR